jgi:hypothetical protein
MSKKRPIENKIEAFYRRSAIDHLLYGWICAYKYSFSGEKERKFIQKTIEAFRKNFDLSEEEYPMESAVNTYYEMKYFEKQVKKIQ